MAEKAARSVSTCALPNGLSETWTGLFFRRSVVAKLGEITIKQALACGSVSYANVNITFCCASTFYCYVCHDLKTYTRSNQTPALCSFDPGFLFSISRKIFRAHIQSAQQIVPSSVRCFANAATSFWSHLFFNGGGQILQNPIQSLPLPSIRE